MRIALLYDRVEWHGYFIAAASEEPKYFYGGATTYLAQTRQATIRPIQNAPLRALIFAPVSRIRLVYAGERRGHRDCVARARRNIPSRAGHTNRSCYYGRKQGVLILARPFGTCVTERGRDARVVTYKENLREEGRYHEQGYAACLRNSGYAARLWNIRCIPKTEWNFWRDEVSARRIRRRVIDSMPENMFVTMEKPAVTPVLCAERELEVRMRLAERDSLADLHHSRSLICTKCVRHIS